MDLIKKYFQEIDKDKINKFEKLQSEFLEWNSKINLISRKDEDSFIEKHLLHSLAIARVIDFKKGSSIMDVGTGGGFPGLALAIMFPDSDFLLVDSIKKKIMVVNDLIKKLDLKNVEAVQERVENINYDFDFIVSRAVTALPKFTKWTRKNIAKGNKNKLKNGILYLKGGDIQKELKQSKMQYKVFPIRDYFEEEFFETKLVVHLF